MNRLLAEWQAKIDSGQIKPDPGQEPVLCALASLADRLDRSAFIPALFRSRTGASGLYIWGGVGGGKSLLMDLFFDSLALKHKQRMHFHEFMSQTHRLIAQWRQRDKTKRPFVLGTNKDADPIPAVAKSLCVGTRLLCFDEFHVNDIADAMLLGRLFEQIFTRQVSVVITSNRHPDDLYKEGLNRDLFEPFIAMLKARTQIIELRAEQDYRLGGMETETLWHAPLDVATQAHMEALWQHITIDMPVEPVTLDVNGRALSIAQTMKGYARMRFSDLCARPLGASDYLALTARFHTLLLEDIPIMEPEKRNEAARFVTLIDTLYEARTRLIASAAAEPEALYRQGHGAFEFERTASRLHEMRQPEFANTSPL